MAYYAALVSLVQLLEDIIHRDRYQNLLLDKQLIVSVHEKFSLLQTLLDDYSPKDREVVDSLERRARDAAYQAQDIIESHIAIQMHQQHQDIFDSQSFIKMIFESHFSSDKPQYLSWKDMLPQHHQDIIESQIPKQVYRKDKTHGFKRVLRHLISAVEKAVLRLLHAQRREDLRPDNVEREDQVLEKIKEEVDSIVTELIRIKKSHATEDLQLKYDSADAGTSNQASGTNTVGGFEERLIKIKGQLCGEPSKLRVVSIVGMGGIGKTTLARNIFDDKLIVYNFDYRAWVTVSQDYHLQKVLLDILNSMNVPMDKSSGVGELEEKIYRHLKGRRYLITMDDIWDRKVWDDVKRILPDDSNGSRIMITTRISDVAFYADRFGFYHQMQFLSEYQSWNLFCEKVFCPSELVDIGRLIAKNCRGLPLAIVVIAGLLTKVNKTRSDWEEIARNVCSTAAENDEHFSKILSLSYNHLPHHLKPCFLYLGGFPENYEIRVSKLMMMWVAEGFLKPIESKSLEEVAEEYLNDLVKRNLVLITKKRSNGKFKRCSIHDVLRDLCTKRIRYENFLHVVHPEYHFHPTFSKNVRRLYIRGYFPSRSQFTKAGEFGSHVRSVICHTNDWKFLLLGSGFKLLRVLDATKERAFQFPVKILELFHLRYLAVDVTGFPPLISLLQNLQVLIIESETWGTMSCSLPSQILEMPNLRHIMSRWDIRLTCEFFDENLGGEPSILENLQTLSWVHNVRFTNKIIEMIPNLRKLKLSCYEEEAAEWRKFHLDNLFLLRQLESLSINFSNTWRNEVNSLPRSFAFPLTLKKLSLRHCRIPWEDMTVVGSLPHLQVLKLKKFAFMGNKWEPAEGEFPKLNFLLMEELDLKYWQAENIHFPTLKHLKISYCHKLRGIPPEIGEISTLELVEVNSSELAGESAVKMQIEQQDMGNDALQVRVYPQYRKFRRGFRKQGGDTRRRQTRDTITKGLEKQEEDTRYNRKWFKRCKL